jgi:hypothetical protein
VRSIALLAAWLALPGLARAQLFAERLDADNVVARRVGGIDAVGGIGDWALGNGTLCAVISDAAHETGTSEGGGGLVDLGHCGRDDDQWNSSLPMLRLGRDGVPLIEGIRAEVSGDEARVRVEAVRDGLRLERNYAVRREPADVLWVSSRVERVGDGPRAFALGEMILHPNSSLALFARSARHPEVTRGFQHPAQDTSSMRGAARAFAPLDSHVLVGDDGIEPGIAYSVELVQATLERASGEREQLPFFAQSGESYTLLGVLTRPFWLGSGARFGWLQLLQMPRMDLGPGDRVLVERAIRVGTRADVASTSNGAGPGMRRVRGHVDDPGARVHIEDAEGRPFSFARPDASGEFAFAAPAGTYRVRALASGGREAARSVEIPRDGTGDVELAWLRLGPRSRVRLPAGAAMRLVFRGIHGTPDPRLRDPLRDLRFGAGEPLASLASNDVSLAGAPGDPAAVELAPGHYRVYATRGPEHAVTSAEIAVGRGEEVELRIAPPARVLDTPGWISADLHVHAGPSNDSGVPLDERVRSFAAQGAEILVSTEHDRLVDLAPRVRALGLEGLLRSVVGSEITSTAHSRAAPRTFGHANAFPLPRDPLAYRGGALRANGRRLRDAIADVRRLGGTRLFQLNHPRSERGEDDDGSFFEHLSFGDGGLDRTRLPGAGRNAPLAEVDPESGLRDLDFDALELLNGPFMARYRAIRADWLWLWLSGEPRTATANSDSHRFGEPVALPRTYVQMPDDALPAFDEAAFVRALREGRAIGTTGPFVELALGGAGIGDTFRGGSGALRVRVQAAPWVPVSTLRVWNGAEIAAERPIGAGQTAEVPLDFARDSFVWVEVLGEPDETFRAIAPGFPPLAFTNPVRVDADDDGRWTPPGLADPLPRVLVEPELVGPSDSVAVASP